VFFITDCNNTCSLLNPKKFGEDLWCRFRKYGKPVLLRLTLIPKNDVTVPKATLIASKDHFQQPFSSLITLFLNKYCVCKWLLKLIFASFYRIAFSSETSFLRNWSASELSGFRFSKKWQQKFAPKFFQSLSESRCLLQLDVKNAAPSV